MTPDEMKLVVAQVQFWNYVFAIKLDGERPYLSATYMDADILTAQPSQQTTRKWLLSPHMTKSELVQTCFKLVITSMEHRVREGFLYRQSRVYCPHYDVDALVELCRNKRLDYRTGVNE